jgi:queuosine biosynthesis protein QueC
MVEIPALAVLSESALTRDVAIAMGESGLPTTFVPGRNLVFFTLAGALAYHRGVKHLVAGMCETDYSGYPDCRDDTIKAMQLALNLGMERRFVIHTPLMWIDKAATFDLAHELGGQGLVALLVEETHSCYLGDRSVRHDWGYGCGECPACKLRSDGFAGWKAARQSAAKGRHSACGRFEHGRSCGRLDRLPLAGIRFAGVPARPDREQGLDGAALHPVRCLAAAARSSPRSRAGLSIIPGGSCHECGRL